MGFPSKEAKNKYQKEWARKYRETHREEFNRRAREYVLAMTPEQKQKKAAALKAWKLKNAERVKRQNNDGNKRYRERHRDEIRKRHKIWREEHIERVRAQARESASRNRKKRLIYSRAYKEAHPGWKSWHCAKRRAIKKNAIPPWADLDKIHHIYKNAKERGLTVDHVIPLNHPMVCGLHCESNLQIISLSENSRKHNSFSWT